MYIIKYFSQYTQPSVGHLCHFTHYLEINVSGFDKTNKNLFMGVQHMGFLFMFLLGFFCYYKNMSVKKIGLI